jgi:hypothetical protein
MVLQIFILKYYYNNNYLDKSPLENYHLSEAFNLLRNKNLNIFEKLKKENFNVLRKRVIDCVLSTDMALHSKQIGQISSKLKIYTSETNNNNNSSLTNIMDFFLKDKTYNKFDLQQEFMNLIMHNADICHASKKWELELKWSYICFEEFFNQGDMEKSLDLPVSFLCDRENTNIPKSQVGFINNILMPGLRIMVTLFPKLDYYISYANKSLDNWEKMANEQEQKDKVIDSDDESVGKTSNVFKTIIKI